MGVQRKCQVCFKKISRVFQECFNKVLFCDFVVAWISSQLPEQKEGLFEHYLVNISSKNREYVQGAKKIYTPA